MMSKYHHKTMLEFKKILLDKEDEKSNIQNDNLAIIGFEIGKELACQEDVAAKLFLYEGLITHNVIALAIDNIEKKIVNIYLMSIVSTAMLGYCQNTMNYAKSIEIGSQDISSAGTIELQCADDEYYNVVATNIVSSNDMLIIEPILQEIQGLSRTELKKTA